MTIYGGHVLIKISPEDQWPDDFYWTIDFGDRSDKPGRDVKINWEANRLQFLLTFWGPVGD